jgi:hypothetical protein
MLNINDTLYFSSHVVNWHTESVWKEVYNSVPYDGQWYLDVSKKVLPNRLVTRNGEWTTPWPQELIPKFAMPAYDPTFNKSFEQVTDENAIRIRDRICQGEKFAVMYSGGIDSTVVLAALIKNLSTEQLKSVTVMCSGESMIENPTFYRKFIHNKLTTLDSKQYKYDDLINLGLTPITADEGDCIFGTIIGLTMYNNFDALLDKISSPVKENLRPLRNRLSDPSVHYSVFKDLIIQYLDVPKDPQFGRILYDKYDHNIKTASVPVYSLHDFFWWLIFNVKYINCSVRGAVYYNDTIDCNIAIHRIVNWFNDADYQRWSMVNNNNGQKIQSSILSYKIVAKDYIYSVDKNPWYWTFKTKLESMWNISNLQNVQGIPVDRRPIGRVAIKKEDWELIYITDPGVKEYFTHHVSQYKIDWTDIK